MVDSLCRSLHGLAAGVCLEFVCVVEKGHRRSISEEVPIKSMKFKNVKPKLKNREISYMHFQKREFSSQTQNEKV